MNYKRFIQLYNGFFLPAGLFAISFLILFYGIIPGIQSIISSYDDGTLLNKEISEIKGKLDILNRLDENTLRTDVETLLSAVPAEKSIGSFLASLENVCSQTGVSLLGFSIEHGGDLASGSAQPKKKPSDNEIMISANTVVGGSPDQLKRMLDTMVSVRRILNASSISWVYLTPDNVRASLIVHAYYQPLPATIGKASEPIQALSAQDEDILSRLASYPELNSAPGPEIQYGTKQNPFLP